MECFMYFHYLTHVDKVAQQATCSGRHQAFLGGCCGAAPGLGPKALWDVRHVLRHSPHTVHTYRTNRIDLPPAGDNKTCYVVGLLVELSLLHFWFISSVLVLHSAYCVSFSFFSVIWLWQDWLGEKEVARHWEVVLPFLHAGDSCSYRVEPPGRCTPHCCCLGSVGGLPSACEGVRTNPSTSGRQAMSLEVETLPAPVGRLLSPEWAPFGCYCRIRIHERGVALVGRSSWQWPALWAKEKHTGNSQTEQIETFSGLLFVFPICLGWAEPVIAICFWDVTINWLDSISKVKSNDWRCVYAL